MRVFLDRVKKGAFLSDHYLETAYFNFRGVLHYLLMTTEHVVLIRWGPPPTIEWEVQTQDIAFCELAEERRIKIYLKMKGGQPSSMDLVFDPEDRSSPQFVLSRLVSLANYEH